MQAVNPKEQRQTLLSVFTKYLWNNFHQQSFFFQPLCGESSRSLSIHCIGSTASHPLFFYDESVEKFRQFPLHLLPIGVKFCFFTFVFTDTA